MWPKHPPITLLLFLTLLPSLPSVLGGGVSEAPNDADPSCESSHSGTVPDKQEVLLDSYYYINLGERWLGQWGFNSSEACMNTVTVCSTSSSSSTSPSLVTQRIISTEATDPIYISVDYACQDCPMCSLSVTEIVNGTEMRDFSCSEPVVPGPFEITPPSTDSMQLQFAVQFPEGDQERCVTLNRVRVYYYEGCPDAVLELTNLPASMPGTIIVDTTCVENAESDYILTARCSSMGEWTVDPCNCSAGFEPNMNNTACQECGDNEYKSSAGNFECAMCGDNTEGSFSDHTGCVCSTGYQGAGCTVCALDYYKTSGDVCMECPNRSARPQGDDESSCTCDPGWVTSGGSDTTTGQDCDSCAVNYYNDPCEDCPLNSVRALMADPSSCTCSEGYTTSSGGTTTMGADCNSCAVNYYNKPGMGCENCPLNSVRARMADPSSCTCSEGYVTSSGSDTTTGDDCNMCAMNYYRTSGNMCAVCPDRSTRALDSDNENECTCDPAYVTSSNSNTTTGDVCSECAPKYGKNSTGDCSGILVRFTQESYTFDESDEIILTVVAEPPPPHPDIIRIQPFSNSSKIKFQAALTQSLRDDSPSADIIISSLDDTTALQEQRSYEVWFSIVDGSLSDLRNTTTIVINDDDRVTVGFSSDSYTVGEDKGKGEVQVELSMKVATQVRVKITCNISSVINTEPSAFSLKECAEILTFEPGMTQMTQTFEFDVTDDSKSGEDDEQYSLTLELLAPEDSRITLSNNKAFVYITDDDQEGGGTAFALGAIIGVCVGGALLAVVAALLCLLCLCMWRVNVNRQGFYPTYEDKEAAPSMLRYSASLRSISSQTVVVAEGKHSTPKENEYFV